ncbi:MAG: hypothetical protein WBO17_10400 [Sphingorhabdus sp.]
MTFIVEKAFWAQIWAMRGVFLTFCSALGLLAAFAPGVAWARDSDQLDSASCSDPKHRHVIIRPLTESAPIRKSEKVRVRRILM